MQYLDPTNKAFAAAIANETGPHVLGYVEGRKALVQIQQHDPAPDILTETTTVSGKYGPTSVVIVRRKELRSRPLPVVFYTHGGGWILGW